MLRSGKVEFLFISVPLKLPSETMLHLWRFGKIMYITSLGNFKAKNQDPSKFHMNFSWCPFEVPRYFWLILDILHAISEIPMEILYFQPSSPGFFLLWEWRRVRPHQPKVCSFPTPYLEKFFSSRLFPTPHPHPLSPNFYSTTHEKSIPPSTTTIFQVITQ